MANSDIMIVRTVSWLTLTQIMIDVGRVIGRLPKTCCYFLAVVKRKRLKHTHLFHTVQCTRKTWAAVSCWHSFFLCGTHNKRHTRIHKRTSPSHAQQLFTKIPKTKRVVVVVVAALFVSASRKDKYLSERARAQKNERRYDDE